MSASNQNKELPMTQFINSIHANDLRWPYSAFWLGLFILSSTMVACTPKPVWKSYQAVSQQSYPGVHWEKADDPEQLGWSSEKLALARRFSEMIGSDAVMIVDNGVVVDAWGDISRNFQCHSMRKSILSALIGIHVEKGNIDLSATIGELGIDDRYPSLSVNEKKATVGDLIMARSGVYHPALGEAASMKGMRPNVTVMHREHSGITTIGTSMRWVRYSNRRPELGYSKNLIGVLPARCKWKTLMSGTANTCPGRITVPRRIPSMIITFSA
jgi:hypothetical protein